MCAIDCKYAKYVISSTNTWNKNKYSRNSYMLNIHTYITTYVYMYIYINSYSFSFLSITTTRRKTFLQTKVYLEYNFQIFTCHWPKKLLRIPLDFCGIEWIFVCEHLWNTCGCLSWLFLMSLLLLLFCYYCCWCCCCFVNQYL